MLDCSCFPGLSSDSLKDTFLLYKRVTEQYKNKDILKVIRLLIPDHIALQTREDINIISLLQWFKNDFMKWTPKDPVCEKCVNSYSYNISGNNSSNISSSDCRSRAPIMQAQVIVGNPWKMRKVEIFKCNNCKHEFTFPRYGEVLKIAETKTGRCSEWSMLFGAILSSLDIEARVVYDFLDHCWNEVKLSPNEKWIHVDSTLNDLISLNHPYYYEENWRKEYEYVLAFSADKVEDVTERYTQQWETIRQRRRLKNNKNNTLDFEEIYLEI
jgi:peptide-N4-(N-acetyl-beta-glucosaminyl)asparagine amidase